MFYFYSNELKFSPQFIGFLRTLNSLALLFGIILYQMYLKHVKTLKFYNFKSNLKRLLFVASILTFFCGLSQLLLITRTNLAIGIPDKFFIITDNIVIVTVAELTSIPLLIYSSRICPKNLEGIFFT